MNTPRKWMESKAASLQGASYWLTLVQPLAPGKCLLICFHILIWPEAPGCLTGTQSRGNLLTLPSEEGVTFATFSINEQAGSYAPSNCLLLLCFMLVYWFCLVVLASVFSLC